MQLHAETDSYDVLIRAGRIVCTASRLDAPGAIALRGDRIVAVHPLNQAETGAPRPAILSRPARVTLDFSDGVLLPGLIDLHAHPACSGSVWGVRPDEHCLVRGTTTVMSQGDAGADNCARFIEETIRSSRTHVKLAINLARGGEAGPGGCLAQLDAADVDACVAAIEQFRESIWGLAINASHHACGTTDPREIVRRGLRVAKAAGVPILYGMRRPEDWPLAQQLDLLRTGDVVTYCYRRTPHCIVSRGRVLPEVRAARGRGIWFDVGHGRGSFDFEVAEQAIADDFPPDTISTDLQRGHVGELPTHDLPLVMSKLLAAGMSELDVFTAVTARPAKILGWGGELGSLRSGARADVVLLHWIDAADPLHDTQGQTRPGGRWQASTVIRAGEAVALPGNRSSSMR